MLSGWRRTCPGIIQPVNWSFMAFFIIHSFACFALHKKPSCHWYLYQWWKPTWCARFSVRRFSVQILCLGNCSKTLPLLTDLPGKTAIPRKREFQGLSEGWYVGMDMEVFLRVVAWWTTIHFYPMRGTTVRCPVVVWVTTIHYYPIRATTVMNDNTQREEKKANIIILVEITTIVAWKDSRRYCLKLQVIVMKMGVVIVTVA